MPPICYNELTIKREELIHMETYQFKTSVVPTTDDFWIDADNTYTIEAETLEEALERFYEDLEGGNFINVSNNARKKKEPMYVDDKEGNQRQIGYVIKGSTEVEFGNYLGDFRKKYVDIWTTIKKLESVDFVDELEVIQF